MVVELHSVIILELIKYHRDIPIFFFQKHIQLSLLEMGEILNLLKDEKNMLTES